MVQPVDPYGSKAGEPFVTIDAISSRIGQLVLVNCEGGGSQEVCGVENAPIQSVIVGIVDNLKAFIAVYIIRILYSGHPDLPLLMIIAGSMAVIGHIFPFFMSFKGGKGVACFMGMCGQ